jgi:hypothetical protein
MGSLEDFGRLLLDGQTAKGFIFTIFSEGLFI